MREGFDDGRRSIRWIRRDALPGRGPLRPCGRPWPNRLGGRERESWEGPGRTSGTRPGAGAGAGAGVVGFITGDKLIGLINC